MFAGISVPVKLKWQIDDAYSSGGYGMMIDFKAEPYGECTFYIGDTDYGDSGTLLFTEDFDCKTLIENMGEIQTYWVNDKPCLSIIS